MTATLTALALAYLAYRALRRYHRQNAARPALGFDDPAIRRAAHRLHAERHRRAA